ncbi:MAG: T9SS type A sorting domain-containing protein [Bacteroidota bacterium]
MKLNYRPFFFLALICLFSGQLSAQLLEWTYEDILTDIQESGANPDMIMDGQGNLHVCYWKLGEDRLGYGRRDKSTGQWTHQTVDQGANFQGFKSAMALDASGKVHIAYLKKSGLEAELKYAHNITGNWIVESPLPTQTLGFYGFDLLSPRFTQLSLDIVIQANGQPAILYFDGRVDHYTNCPFPIITAYDVYELDMNLLTRQAGGAWGNYPFQNIADRNQVGCMPFGDRFGEFCQLKPGPNGEYYALTNSLHNHDLLFYRSAPGSLNSWTKVLIDSVSRQLNNNVNPGQIFREGFEFPAMEVVNDTGIHLLYGASNFYGKNAPLTNRKPVIYTYFNSDSLGAPGYQPFHHSFGFLNEYRSFFSLSTKGNETVFASYYHQEIGALMVETSFNKGLDWTKDTVDFITTNSRLNSAVYQDSLFVLAYNGQADELALYSRSISGGAWNVQRASLTEVRGASLSSEIYRTPTDDEVHVVYTESSADQLMYGKKALGSWSHTPIGSAGKGYFRTALHLGTNQTPHVVYAQLNPRELVLATENNGIWTTSLIDDMAQVEDVSFEIFQNQIHVVYYDIAQGHLAYAWSANAQGPWLKQVIDSTSQIVGIKPSLFMKDDGSLHLSYVDGWNSQVKYAVRSATGIWSVETVTEPFNYIPSYSDIAISDTGQLSLAFRDDNNNTIQLATREAAGNWTLEEVVGVSNEQVGAPLRMLFDTKHRPWVLYNSLDLLTEIKLVRKAESGSWTQVSVLNNAGFIGNVFDFHLIEDDFYIIGKKNKSGDEGLGLLYAENGVRTSLEASLAEASFRMFPNPSSGSLRIQLDNPSRGKLRLAIYNLNGQRLHLISDEAYGARGQQRYEADLSHLAPGMYLVQWQGETFQVQRKLVLMPK